MKFSIVAVGCSFLIASKASATIILQHRQNHQSSRKQHPSSASSAAQFFSSTRPFAISKDIRKNTDLHLVLRLRGGHCQVPCGIFDDPMIVAEIKQCVVTITKAMVQIAELEKGGTSAQDLNQIVRWINTKEEHACKIITTVSEYCLCQRVKKEIFASEADYADALKAHHAVMQAAMKCKQTVDVAAAHGLEHAVGDFEKMYKPQE